jgi:hypothetical protein
MSKEQKHSSVIMPKFTLPDSANTGEHKLEQMQTQRILPPPVQTPRMLQIQTPLILQPPGQMSLTPMERPLTPFRRMIESMITIHDSPPLITEFLDIEDDDALILDTVSMNAVKKIRTMRKVGAFFSNFFLLLISILFLCVLATLLITISNLTYKSGFLIAFVISFSYVVSAQVKRFDRARHRKILTAAQLAKKGTLSEEEDDMMKHMKVIKEDTMTYLRTINDKSYRKRRRR